MAKQPYSEVPGNAIASDQNYWKYLLKIANGVLDITACIHEPTELRPLVRGLTIKCDVDDEEGVLIVVKADTPHEPVVAFHRGADMTEALMTLGRRLKNNSLKWKKDEYA